mmetsp:Transcript_2898/g.5372  ORF Transcript_2898/g.5372 Transcript_2898/m.5372 type:complete len:276 (-) Transcript_2898:162-989(-)|eukprot:CAMPEP_0197530266 /NCGR_PEP_ID=MMETSP1318-20131121/31296_1 /TAXON_ID=552666 /ORGANISM="Partenskyella glossopodia, Strain RCC365" /LENGTH=275 /DNA_ID=CAMNT_0043086011 /DNA_START=197 /DNA_END=1024 /DNA_ORIENTATION=+
MLRSLRGGGATVSSITQQMSELWYGNSSSSFIEDNKNSSLSSSSAFSGGGFLDRIGVDLGHQEMQAILNEIEQTFASTPAEWLPANGIASLVAHNLGYEDVEELNSAMNMTFSTFVQGFPHIDTKNDDEGRLVFRVKKERPKEEWTARKMVYKINSTKDLWTVFLKSKNAIVRIPELNDFEFSPDGVKRIDTIYNHIGTAIFNLGNHVRQGPGKLDSYERREKIMTVVYQLNTLLDVPRPFTWEVYDPSGTCEFKPSDAVEVHDVEPEEAEPPAH